MKLSLDSLTVTNTAPAELIRAARSAGFDQVSLWVQPPPIFPLQLVTVENARDCMAALKDTGIAIGALEVFVLSSAAALESYRPALEMGARMGGKSASSINVGNADQAKVADLFAKFAEIAREYGLSATHEPLAMFETKTLAQARDIVLSAPMAAGIVVDAFHVVRAGGTAADVRALDSRLIWHVQLCDGPAAVPPEGASYESTCERLYPGDGEFGLAELFRDAPTDVSWGIEAPSLRRAKAGMSAEQQAREVMMAMLRVIDQIPAAKKSLGR